MGPKASRRRPLSNILRVTLCNRAMSSTFRFGKTQASTDKSVIAPDGMISFPLIGQVKAAGKTIPTLEKEFSKRLSKNYQTAPQVTITLSAVREGMGSQVFITGEVNKPGPIPLMPGMSVMQAIAMSGGLGRFAAKSRIQIHRRVRGAEQVFLFDYSDFLSGSNPASDIVLEPGDVIVVPERGLFY